MSEIRRAVVKSYDAVAHKAAVQIAGSLAVWLDDVRVATNIPPADVSAGRQCTVLFMDPSNQDDAVIIAIQGAAPSGGGASDHKVIVTSDDTNADYLLSPSSPPVPASPCQSSMAAATRTPRSPTPRSPPAICTRSTPVSPDAAAPRR